jgi:hypothetical protein
VIESRSNISRNEDKNKSKLFYLYSRKTQQLASDFFALEEVRLADIVAKYFYTRKFTFSTSILPSYT